MKTFEKWRRKEPSRIKSVISEILWKNIFTMFSVNPTNRRRVLRRKIIFKSIIHSFFVNETILKMEVSISKTSFFVYFNKLWIHLNYFQSENVIQLQNELEAPTFSSHHSHPIPKKYKKSRKINFPRVDFNSEKSLPKI